LDHRYINYVVLSRWSEGLQFAGVDHCDLALGRARVASKSLNPHNDIVALQDLSKDDVFSIKPWGFDGGDKELRPGIMK
jgi:hypothetical protein